MQMGAAQIIRSVSAEASAKRRRTILRHSLETEGLGQALFEEVASLLGEDPSEAGRLAALGRVLIDSPAHQGFAHRTLAVEARLRGQWVRAAQHFIEAGATSTDSRRAEMSVGAIDCLARAGDVPGALNLAKRLLGSTSDPLTKGRIALNAGNAALWVDDYAAGRAWCDQSLAFLPEEQVILRASASLGLSTSHLYGGSPADARSQAEFALRAFEETAQPAYSRAAELNLCAANILLGRADRALPSLLGLADSFDPMSSEWARTQELIGDGLTQLNRFEDAIFSFTQALTHPTLRHQPLNRALCVFSIGHALSALGRNSEALKHLRQSRRALTRLGNRVWSDLALARELELSGSRARIERWNEASSSPFVEVKRRMLRARTMNSVQDLEVADSLIQSCGYRSLRWESQFVRALISQGNARLDALRNMAAELFALRLTQDSRLANSRFFGDKFEAIQLYISELIDRDLTDELLETLRRSRSVALVNELESASKPKTERSASFLRRLDKIRDALSEEMKGWPQSDLERRVTTTTQNAALDRSWTELLSLLPNVDALVPTTAPPILYGETKTGYFRIQNQTVSRLPGSPERIRTLLRWLRFEIEAPRLNRQAASDEYLEFAQELYEALGNPQPGNLNPDGALWDVPWPVLFATAGFTQESILTLGPWESPAHEPLRTDRVALWTYAPPGLPHIAEESAAFLRAFPHAEVCRTRSEIERCLESGPLQLLHVAGHVATHPTNPSFSSLLVEDGHIPSGLLALSNFHAETVVLSACDTAHVDFSNRSEPDGWVRAFLGIGARTVIGSQWPLDDEAGTCFFRNFYEIGSQCDTLLEAMQFARCETRKQWAHPYFWGQMNIYGGLPR